ARRARILGMHRRDRRDALALRDLAGERARQAVAPRTERRARDEHVGLDPVELGADRTRGLLATLADEVVPADQRGLDAGAVAQCRLEGATRADGAGLRRHAGMGLVLSADPAEDLVPVVTCWSPS